MRYTGFFPFLKKPVCDYLYIFFTYNLTSFAQYLSLSGCQVIFPFSFFKIFISLIEFANSTIMTEILYKIAYMGTFWLSCIPLGERLDRNLLCLYVTTC